MKFHQSEKFTAEDKLISAKIKLVMNNPFFGNLVSRFELIETKNPKIKTGATDGVNIFYNKEWIDKLDVSECVFFLAHEVCHIILFHFDRQDGRDTDKWNIAADYATNSILIKNQIGKRIANTLYDQKYDNMYSEEIYDLLPKCLSGKSLQELLDKLLDEHLDLEQDADGNIRSKEQIDSIKTDIKEAIISSLQNCSASEQPLGLERLIENLVSPKLDWREIIRNTIKSKVKCDFTWQRPSRKTFDSNIILPTMDVEDEVEISIAFDMSGSIGDDAAIAFLSEVQGIVSEFRSWKINIWSFDTEVYNYKKYSSYEDPDILSYVPKGGGGTMYECNWTFMKKLDITPKLFIMFTDMYPCGGWGDATYCDTLFVAYGNSNTVAPFGETIKI